MARRILSERQRRQRTRLLGEGRRFGLRIKHFRAIAAAAKPLKAQGLSNEQIAKRLRNDGTLGIDWTKFDFEKWLAFVLKWLPVILALFA